MSDPVKPSQKYIGPYIGALLVLAALVLGMRRVSFAGVVAAIAVYFLISRLRKPTVGPRNQTPISDMLAELTAHSQRIASHAIRVQIGGVVSHARTLHNYLQTQPDTQAWQDFVRDCLASSLVAVRKFATYSPHVTEPTDPQVSDFSKYLNGIAGTLGSVHTKVTLEHAADTPAYVGPYKNTLHDINQTYLGTGSGG